LESGTHIYYGASTSAVRTWLNFDASPTVRVQNIPLLGKRLARLAGNGFDFPEFLKYGDIVKGLPVADASADAVYASHVLEHLTLDDMRTALRNTYRMLKPGGVFRLIVPDLRERARRYLARAQADPDDPQAALDFVHSTDLGESRSMRGSVRKLRQSLGFARHHWMWDYPSMARELQTAGFTGIRRARFGDADDPRFTEVEQMDRYFTRDIEEVGIEARRPAD
jgi:predicted SAM-dependent methyltransferase